MGILFLDRKDLKLRLDGQRLVIEEPEQRPQGVPLSLLERVVIQGRVGLDSALLAELGERGIGVLLMSGRHSRRRGGPICASRSATVSPGWSRCRPNWTAQPVWTPYAAWKALRRRLISPL